MNITERAAVIVRKDGLKRADIVVDKWNFFFFPCIVMPLGVFT